MKTKEEREQLEHMLENSPKEITKNASAAESDIANLQGEPLIDVNFGDLKEKCEEEARIMINNAISFMFPLDMITNNEYLKNKLEVDIMSLAGMIYQLRTNEIVQKTLMQQISSGMTHPRMFEVFSGMSKTIGDLNKQLLQTVEALRETYRNLKQDVKDQRTEALGPVNGPSGMLTTGDGGIVTRGTKELINNVKRLKNEQINNSSVSDAKLIPDINFDNINQ